MNLSVRTLALGAIRLYQRHLSPLKGFKCAYRVHTGRAGCSELGARAVRRYGLLKGLALIRARTRRCGIAHRRYGQAPCPGKEGLARSTLHTQRGQRGVCDAGCDVPLEAPCHGAGHESCASPCDGPCSRPCDSTPGRLGANLCDVADCCGCDWPSRNRKTGKDSRSSRREKREERERAVHLPPRR